MSTTAPDTHLRRSLEAAGYRFEKYVNTDFGGIDRTYWRFVTPADEEQGGYHRRGDAVLGASWHHYGPWHSRCETFAAALQALPYEDTKPEDTASLAKEHGLTWADFVELDEKPGHIYVPGVGGYANGHWHALLRQARNNGALFIDGILRKPTRVP